MQALDAGATEKYGIPSILLMEVVGRPYVYSIKGVTINITHMEDVFLAPAIY